MIEYGFCMICEKEIAPKCSGCNTRKPSSQYTNVEVQWANGARMQIGVCVDCATKNAHCTDEAKAKITKAHHDHWDALGGKHDKGIVLV